jgi:hypothetical protein
VRKGGGPDCLMTPRAVQDPQHRNNNHFDCQLLFKMKSRGLGPDPGVQAAVLLPSPLLPINIWEYVLTDNSN